MRRARAEHRALRARGVLRRILKAEADAAWLRAYLPRLVRLYGGWERLGRELPPGDAARVAVAAIQAAERSEAERDRLQAELSAEAGAAASDPAAVDAAELIIMAAGDRIERLRRMLATAESE